MSKKGQRAVIVGYVRSPFTPAKKGELKDVRADDLVAQTVKGLVSKTGVDTSLIEDLKLGNAFPEGEQGFNMARNVVFLSDLPDSVPGVTINRFCGSSMQALHDAVAQIELGNADAMIVAGVESMTRTPMGGFNPLPNPKLFTEYPAAYMSMGETAENVAKKHKISRDEQEALAIASHEKASNAMVTDLFKEEIIEITTPSGKKVSKDGCVRPGTNKEGLSGLKPAFDKAGSVTAGTSSPLTDGAVALLVVSEDFAKEHGLESIAMVKSMAVTGCSPELMGMGPVKATEKALRLAGLTMDDIDIIEINEAFGSQSVACIKALGMDMDKVNLDGGAIALGHPLGASGARISGKASQVMSRENKKYALATMCMAGGQGIATIFENPNYKNDNTPKQAAKKTNTPKPTK